MIVATVVIFEILGILSAIHSIMSTRTPQGTIAWAVSLIALPYVSVPAYWVFGRDKFRGYVLTRQNELELIDDVIRQANDQITPVAPPDDWRSGVIVGAEKLARIPLTGGNKVDLLIDGDATFASIFNGIDAADMIVKLFAAVEITYVPKVVAANGVVTASPSCNGGRIHFCRRIS